ncbi:MAG: hypothetical protein P8163_14285 [Candidatus Thiodiazotropha sp.]
MVFTYPSPSHSVVDSMTVYDDKLFVGSWVYGWNHGTCTDSYGVYVSSNGDTFNPTNGIPSCCSVDSIFSVDQKLISITRDYYDPHNFYFYVWDAGEWRALGSPNFQPISSTRPMVAGAEDNYIYSYGSQSENAPTGIYRSADLGLTWNLIIPLDTPLVSRLDVKNNVLYIDTWQGEVTTRGGTLPAIMFDHRSGRSAG